MSEENLVTLTVDGKEVTVQKGSNLIDAAREAGVDVPHYCYHPDLSVAGNCRMCQVEVEGAPKLMIGCHTQVQPDMKVKTQESSQEVKDAQSATLEFILINHPLDCTVCDQAGHCKLQDYHYEYNAKQSRFIEEKVHKPKAVPLGPTVMLDAERCIMCTRCIRFCDEVTETSELGMLERGDRSMIAINPGKELDNPFSANVVDLCPVGALTHKDWRFNTRIWYTKQVDTICTGCSTGCNVKVAMRDDQIVHVKGRRNEEVNKDWLCDEGRYGFMRFVPEKHLAIDEPNFAAFKVLKDSPTLFLVAPDLFLEDYYVLRQFIDRFSPDSTTALAYKSRELSELESMLISPNYAANFKGAQSYKLCGEDPAAEYQQAIQDLKAGKYDKVCFLGDRSCFEEDLSFLNTIEFSAAMLSDANSPLVSKVKHVLPARSVYQCSGTMMNSKGIKQASARLLEYAHGTYPVWQLLNLIAEVCGLKIVKAESDREVSLEVA